MQNIARKLVVLLLGLLVSLFVGELVLMLVWKESTEEITPQFKYNYLDIYTKAFKKIGRGERARYRSVRPLMEQQVFSVSKNKQTKRIFIIGESTAQQFDISLLQAQLKRVMPQLDFEIINCGMGAYDAYRTRLIGEEIVNYQPDLIIVLVGNSEFHTTRRVNRFRYRGFLSKSHLFRMLTDQINPPLKIDNLKTANTYYRANVLKLFKTIKKRRIPAVLCTLPVNYRYYNSTRMIPLKYLVFNMLYLHFEDFELSEKMTRSLGGREGFESYIYYQLGKLSDKQKHYKEAVDYYSRQLDSAQLPITCPPQRNDLIRQLASENDIVLADIQNRFNRLVPNGIPGFDLFKDNNHVWPSAYQIYSEEIVDAVYAANQKQGKKMLAASANWQTDKLKSTGYEKIVQKIAQDKHGSEHRLLKLLIFSVATHKGPVSMDAVDLVKQIFLINNDFFNTLPSVKEAVIKELLEQIWVNEMQTQVDGNQFWARVQNHIGIGLLQLGQWELGEKHFNRAVRLDGNNYTPFLFRGITRYLAGEKDNAIEDFGTAAEKNPSFDWGEELAAYLKTKL